MSLSFALRFIFALVFFNTVCYRSVNSKKSTIDKIVRKVQDENIGFSNNGVRTYVDILFSARRAFNRFDGKETKYAHAFQEMMLLDKFLANGKEELFNSKSHGIRMNPEGLLKDDVQEERSCSADINTWLMAAATRRQWALEMIDAAGKPGSGMLRRKPPVPFLGEFDECMDVETGEGFETRYCTTIFWITKIGNNTFPVPITSYLGICMPSSCNASEIEGFINIYFQSNPAVIVAGAVQTNCQERDLPLTTKAKVVICVCSMFATLMLLGTVYDVFYLRWFGRSRTYTSSMGMEDQIPADGGALDGSSKHRSEYEPLLDDKKKSQYYVVNKQDSNGGSGIVGQLLLSFSVYTNASKMLSTHQSPDSIDCIHGIRFISMTWVILGHTYIMAISVMNNVTPYLELSYERWTFQAVQNALVSVDTFFALSGLLMTYLVLKELGKKGVSPKFFGLYYFHRFWRLTPPYMLVMMTYIPLYKYISDGPVWPQNGVELDECEDTWWTNLLYVNNFVKDDKMCMGWSWYLSNDMQFYVISPLLFLPLYFFGTAGLLAPFAFLLGTAVTSGVISNANDLETNIDILNSNQGDYFSVYYIKPFCRMGPYIIGMMTGYILFKCECRARLPRLVVLIGWMAAAATALAVLYGLYDHTHDDPLPRGVADLYNALHKIAWGLSVCWVIFACANGYGGFVNTLLSWKALVPLSRLTYCAYLVHPLVIFFFYFSQRSLFYLNNTNVSYAFVAMVVLSYAVAFVASMAYEAPMMGLEKALRSRGRKSPSKT